MKTYIGGLGTGALRIGADGTTALCGAVKTTDVKKNAVDTVNPLSFAVYSDGTVCRLLYREDDTDAVPADAFIKCDDGLFCRMTYLLGTLTISAEYVTPCLMHNAVDSGIPCVFVTFLVHNNTEKDMDFSLIGRVKSFFGRASAVTDYFKKEKAAFVGLSTADTEDEYAKMSGIGIACDAADFTYAAMSRINDAAFLRTVRDGCGYLTNTGHHADNVLLAAHECVKAHSDKTVRFVMTWHCPSRNDGNKSYYSHCFTDERACAAYCFAEYDRLMAGTRLTHSLLFEGAAANLFGDDLTGVCGKITSPFLFRGADGHIENVGRLNGCDELLYPAELNASLTADITDLLHGGIASDTDHDTVLRAMRVLLRYFSFVRQTGDISYFEANDTALTDFAISAIDAACSSDCAVRDRIRLFAVVIQLCGAMMNLTSPQKKKYCLFEQHREGCKDELVRIFAGKAGRYASLLLSEAGKSYFYCGSSPFDDSLLISAAADCRPDKDSADYFAALTLMKLGEYEKAAVCAAHLHDNARADGLYAAAMAAGGFDYDALTHTLAMRPADTYADTDGITRAFFCVPTAYGVVEQGEDYIELRVMGGRLDVQNVLVSHRPYKVLYRGRLMPCVIDGNTVTLESALIVDEDRKLTVLVDTAK